MVCGKIDAGENLVAENSITIEKFNNYLRIYI